MTPRILICVLMALSTLVGSASAFDPPSKPPVLKKRPTSPRQKELERAQKRRERTKDLLRLLNATVERVEFDEDTLEEVFEWFKARGLKNLVIRWKVLEQSGEITRQTPLTLSLQGATLGEILDMVLSLVSDQAQAEQDRLTYHVFDGMVKISSRADFDRHTYTRTYYVEDLLYPLTLNELLPYMHMGQQFAFVAELDPVVASGAVAQRPIVEVIETGSHHGPGDPGYGRPDFKGVREEELQKLVALLKSVRPKTWEDEGGKGTITPFGDKLVITQTIEMHEIIGGAFEQMRTLQNKREPKH